MRKHHDAFFIQGSGFRVQGSGFRVVGSGGGFAAKKEANPASLRSAAPSKGRGSRGCSLLPLEGGVPKGRIGHWRYERERGGSSQVGDIREHPIHRCAVPLPHAGKAYMEAASPRVYMGRCPKAVFKSPVPSP